MLNHIGFIVDGNRRWARANGVSIYQGHKRGFEVLKDMAYAVQERGIPYTSAFIFSTENWNRTPQEVADLMSLFRKGFKDELNQMIADNFRIIFLGRQNKVPADILDEMRIAEEKSLGNTGTTLALCFNYGGQAEIVDAARHLAADVQAGRASLADMDETKFRNYLYHPELPDLDMLVRTSGEQRISGFQLWRSAYTEMMWLDKNWPDITAEDLDAVIAEYNRRHRRFGK